MERNGSIHRGYPAKRALSAMRIAWRLGPFWQDTLDINIDSLRAWVLKRKTMVTMDSTYTVQSKLNYARLFVRETYPHYWLSLSKRISAMKSHLPVLPFWFCVCCVTNGCSLVIFEAFDFWYWHIQIKHEHTPCIWYRAINKYTEQDAIYFTRICLVVN